MNGFQPYEIIAPKPGSAGEKIVIIADHASNHVPDGINLGVPPEVMTQHVAIDIGVAEVTRLLCEKIGCGAVLARVSRLVIDFNREEDAAGLIPLTSDGIDIPGNLGVDPEVRLAAYYRPYHDAVARTLAAMAEPFIFSLHSFTPELATRPEEARPWHIGILYNRDDRAARIAIPLLAGAGLNVGDQLPYSGALLNATMNRHAEAPGRAYLGVEMRQDQVSDAAGAARMAEILAPVLLGCRNRLA
ncbi:putative N-formylglutamate amidohydrolase [Blastomonas natatoria]|uniref:Putative N-formylglutamate amidohydrolase n=1 Tax=Blastomonas natatoria TaxID=34015 RepID=A0A2V3V095_9SPHN|nr:N-formylglutamate amidohydrolase [Blastomonas natatoria]PXW75152.1 putative N-formylglutamate amidohydrolase [Blastomonas natatoria]